MTAPWPLTGGDVLTQVRWIVWEFEGAKHGHRVVVRAGDRGGRTLSGLTWRTYSRDYLRLPAGTLCPQAEFDALTLDDVVDVILELFALRTNIHRIADLELRFAVLDYAIHAGADDAIPALQRALGIAADGIFGPDTTAALQAHPDPRLVRDAVIDARYQKAGRQVLTNREQLAFLNGWLVRVGRVLRWRAAIVVLAIAAASCAATRYVPEPPHPSPAQLQALLEHAAVPPATHPPAMTLRLTPPLVLAGGATWVRCDVPLDYGAGRVRYGIEGLRVSEGPLEQISARLLVEHIPCGRWAVVCAVATRTHTERLVSTLEPLGCADPGAAHS